MGGIASLSTSIYEVWLSLTPLLFIGALIAGILHITLPRNLIQQALSGRGGVWRAVLIGIPLPLCSCGVIPTGLGLRRDGASRGATVGFLISTPQTGVDSILVSGHLLGYPFALFKVIAALITGLLGGVLTDRFEEEDRSTPAESSDSAHQHQSQVVSPWKSAFLHGQDVIESIWGWILAGVLISACIDQVLPSFHLSQIATTLSSETTLLLSYFLILCLSLPLYVCATASVPIAAVLMSKGLPIGAALIFLMAGPATNIATIGSVYRVLGKKSLLIYLSVITLGSIAFAFVLDTMLNWQAPLMMGTEGAHEHHFAWWEKLLATLMAGWFTWLIFDWFRSTIRHLVQRENDPSSEIQSGVEHQLEVKGMTCQSCVKRLREGLLKRDDIVVCEVNHQLNQATVRGTISIEDLQSAISSIGFSASPLQDPLTLED